MKYESKQEILDRLLDELSSQLDEYYLTLEADRIFEIRKDIRQRIKEIRRRIANLVSENPVLSQNYSRRLHIQN